MAKFGNNFIIPGAVTFWPELPPAQFGLGTELEKRFDKDDTITASNGNETRITTAKAVKAVAANSLRKSGT